MRIKQLHKTVEAARQTVADTTPDQSLFEIFLDIAIVTVGSTIAIGVIIAFLYAVIVIP